VTGAHHDCPCDLAYDFFLFAVLTNLRHEGISSGSYVSLHFALGGGRLLTSVATSLAQRGATQWYISDGPLNS
jgi:hypothetical protein